MRNGKKPVDMCDTKTILGAPYHEVPELPNMFANAKLPPTWPTSTADEKFAQDTFMAAAHQFITGAIDKPYKLPKAADTPPSRIQPLTFVRKSDYRLGDKIGTKYGANGHKHRWDVYVFENAGVTRLEVKAGEFGKKSFGGRKLLHRKCLVLIARNVN